MHRCLECGAEIMQSGRGRRRKYCVSCAPVCYRKQKHRHHKATYMPGAPAPMPLCACGQVAISRRYGRCRDCSERNKREREKRRPPRIRRGRRFERRCQDCGISFTGPTHDAKRCPSCRKRTPKPKPDPIIFIKTCPLCWNEFEARRCKQVRCPDCIQAGTCYDKRRERPADWDWRSQIFNCAQCGMLVISPRPRRYCSKRCQARAAKSRHRAIKRDAYREDVFRASIFERDGWKCQLCGKPTDRDAVAPNGGQSTKRESIWAPTIDHIVPYDCGGTHEPANVQCAHFICNSRKAANGCGSQLRLVG